MTVLSTAVYYYVRWRHYPINCLFKFSTSKHTLQYKKNCLRKSLN